LIIATILFTLALFLGSRLDLETQAFHIALVLLLFGAGMGAFNPPNQSAMIGATPRSSLATTLGVANTLRLLGSATGTAIGGTLYIRSKKQRNSLNIRRRASARTWRRGWR
jgi:predicted MFS family arabinose efflux permease